MRLALLSSLLAFAAPGLCALSVRDSDSPHVLRLGLKRNHVDNPVGRDRRRFKRQTVDVDLYGDSMGGDIYSANLTVGTPPQQVEVSVDTGSSDLWVVYSSNEVCTARSSRCDSLGTYDPNDSSTSTTTTAEFEIVYGDQSWARGYYATDTIEIGDAEVPQLQFGIAMTSSIDKGILGIGYSTNVAARYRYPNLPELLASNNITSSNAYSLWLNRLGEDEGNVLFGGVNTAHYTGDLLTLPIIPYNGSYVHLWLTLTDLSVESEADDITQSYSAHTEFPVVVLLDSGATISYLPADIVAQIYNDLDVYLYEDEQFGYVPCNTYLSGREDYTVNFSFSGLTIAVPLRELVLHDAMYYQGGYLDIDGEESCIFGIAPSADFFPILGDSFLRSAYVVFDLDNNEISMAQANYDPGDDEILEIASGDDGVPRATPVQDPVTTATVVVTGSALVFPEGHTNEPIFPSRTTTTTVVPSTTGGNSASPSGSGTVEDENSGDEDGAGSLRRDPLLLTVGVVGGLLLVM
ncbi:aspartic peptidase domain-containing protein [Aspergillus californicus]